MLGKITDFIVKALLPSASKDETAADEAPEISALARPFAEALAHFRDEDYAAAAASFQQILDDLHGSAHSPVWHEARRYLLLCYIHLNREPEAAQLLAVLQETAATDQAQVELQQDVRTVINAWVQKRARGLRNYWWASFLFLLLFLVISVSEASLVISPSDQVVWWQRATGAMADRWNYLLANYPVTLGLLLIGVILFIFGARWILYIDDWLSSLWQWSVRHPKSSGALAIISIFLIFSILTNANSWSFNTVEVWSEDTLGQTGQEIEVVFRTNLNGVGSNPLASIPLLQPLPPAVVTRAQETFQPLALDSCEAVLLEPVLFVPNPQQNVISLSPLVNVQDRRGTGDPVRLPTAVGTFDLPLDNVTRLLFRYFVPNYRELNAQIIPAPQNPAHIRMVVVSSPSDRRWLVEGPRDAIPQMINFMAARIALDWTFQQTNQVSDKIENHTLAFALGSQAYVKGDLKDAQIYYDLANFYNSMDANIQMMRGLTRLRLQASQNASDTLSTAPALEALQRAVQVAPARSVLKPYLACLYQWQGQTELAETTLTTFNDDLEQAAIATAASARAMRQEALAALPTLGPGQRLFVTTNKESAEALDVYYTEGDAIVYTLGWIPNTPLQFLRTSGLDDTPRQLFAIDDGLFVITADGLVDFFNPRRQSLRIIIGANDLTFTPVNAVSLIESQSTQIKGAAAQPSESAELNMGGVRQILITTHEGQRFMFVLDRFGRIHRMRLEPANEGETYLASRETVLLDATARQIAFGDTALYFLKEDGAVWRVPAPYDDAPIAIQVPESTGNRQIAVQEGNIYALRDDNSIWRFRADAAEPPLQIDPDPGTRRIIISTGGLFVLKENGKIWQITNPTNARFPDDFRIVDGQENSARLGIFAYQNRVFALDAPPAGAQLQYFPNDTAPAVASTE